MCDQIYYVEYFLINDGTAADLATSTAAVISKVGNNIQKHAWKYGLKTNPRWLTDGESVSVLVGVQLGHRRAFPNSEEISVKIFDDDNIKVILTDNIVRALYDFGKSRGVDVKQLMSFASDIEAMRFLDVIYSGVGAILLK